jgi:hypothetical protein
MSTRFTHVDSRTKKCFDLGVACKNRDGIKFVGDENQSTEDGNEDRSPKTRTTQILVISGEKN